MLNRIYFSIFLPLLLSCGKIEEFKEVTITFEEQHWSQISELREKFLRRGTINAGKKDFVPAQIAVNDSIYNVKVRLKGDWIDHLKTKNWSYRVKSKKPILGMTTFNFHYPNTKSYANQWLFMQACKKEGIITPQHFFIKLIHPLDTSVYQVMEHFDMLMLDKNKVLRSPIIRFDESEPWNQIRKGISWSVERDSLYFFRAKIDAYQSKLIKKNPQLKILYKNAKKKLQKFRSGKLPTSEVFDKVLFARYFVLSDLFGAEHGLRWHNLRFYYNPNTGKLCPVAFDNAPGHKIKLFSFQDPGNELNKNLVRLFFSDQSFLDQYFTEANRILHPDYYSTLLTESKTEHEKIIKFLKEEFPDYNFSEYFFKHNTDKYQTIKIP